MARPYYKAYEDRYRRAYDLGVRTWRTQEPHGELPRFLERCTSPPGRAADLGCGEGIDAIWLAEQGWAVTAVDLSPTAISRAKELALEAGQFVDFRVGDVTKLSRFPDRAFDLALSISVLHILVERKHRQRHLQEVHRILRPDSWLFLDCLAYGRGREGRPVPAGEPVHYDFPAGKSTRRVTVPAVASTRLTDRQLRQVLSEAGFSPARVYRVGSTASRRMICWAQKAARCGRKGAE